MILISMKRSLCLAVTAASVLLFSSGQSQEKLKADLDPFITLPGAYQLRPENLPRMFEKGTFVRNPYFEWLNVDKTRAIFKRKPASNVEVDLTIMKGAVAVQEMVVDFKDGRFLGVTISIFNRGDAGEMSQERFRKAVTAVSVHFDEQLAARKNERAGNVDRGILTSGYTWISGRGMALLEHNPGVRAGKSVSFLRMRLCRRDAKGAYAAAMKEKTAAALRQSELVKNRKVDLRGNVYVDNVPMVDQGGKGYCVVASVQRLFEYYGAPCDMHQLAEIAGADPDRGTSILTTNQELGAIDHLFKMRYSCLAVKHDGVLKVPNDEKGKLYVSRADKGWGNDDFKDAIRKYADVGIPLLWALQLGDHEEIPPISPQSSGGHMRLIIGYNNNDNTILFSDSWGAGHELKSMEFPDAYRATDAIFLMKPVTN